jgi:hypothetical protein
MRDLAFHPDFQPVDILPFDEHTLRDGFTLQPGRTEDVEGILGLGKPAGKKGRRKRPRDSQLGESISHPSQLNASTNGTPAAATNGDGATPESSEPYKKKRRKEGP